MVTTDGTAVLFHDPNLKRLHGIDVGVEELSYDQLRDLLNGKQQVCTLHEALSLADDYDCWVDIEIKTMQWHVVRETVSKFSPKKKIISSFRHDVVSDWAKLDNGRYLFAYIYQHFPKDIDAYLREVDLLKPEISFLDERYDGIADRVLPWTVNTVMDYLRKEYRKQREAFLPLEFELGAYAEVDWTEAYFYLKGKETKAHLFVMKLRGSGGFYVRAYPFEKQEAFFDGHIKCFEFMNGVPYKIAYDNLKTAVKKILEGSNREEQEQFIALRTHYLYESSFCRPAKGSDKGGVENAGKEAVRRFFVPYPRLIHLRS